MKKLLLLSALLIFACSSDEGNNDNNNSNQNFLQKYDGVIWKFINNDPEDGFDYWVTFSPNGFNECEGYDQIEQGYSYNWGEVIDGYSHSIIENSPERLVTETIELDDDGETYTYTTTAEATNNGNSLVLTYSDDIDYIENYDRVSINPCN